MVSRTRAKKKIVEVPQLCYNGKNWSNYCEKLFQAAEAQRLLGLLNGTNPKPSDLEPWNPWHIATWLCDGTEVQYLLVMTTPALIWNHFTISTSHAMFQYLKNLFEESTVAMTTVHNIQSINSARVAVYYAARTPDDCTHMQRTANENAPNTNEVRKGSGRRWENSLRNGTHCRLSKLRQLRADIVPQRTCLSFHGWQTIS